MARDTRRSTGDRSGHDEQRSAIERRFLENNDVARRFGAEVTVEAPAADDAGFFLVKRRPTVDPQEFRSWLLSRIGGRERVLLETATGVFVVWGRFGEAHALREAPTVELVGGVSVDIERLQRMLDPSP